MFQFGGFGALFKPPRGKGTEQNVDKSGISCRSHYFFLQAFMNGCSSCYYRS